MDTKQKIQRVLDVIDGKQHPSSLVEVLPKPDEDDENVVKLAVNYLVARCLEKANAPASSYFRLQVAEGEDAHFTDWLPERSQLSAPMEMGKVRQQFPRAEISVERSSHPEM